MQALNGKRARIDDLEIHQPHAIIPVEGWGTPIFDAQGNVEYAIAAFQDITERKQTEQLLAQLQPYFRATSRRTNSSFTRK